MRRVRFAAVVVTLILPPAWAGCSSGSTDQKLEKIAKNKKLSDKEALAGMAKEVLSGSGHPLEFEKLPAGDYHLKIRYHSLSSSRTPVGSVETFRKMQTKYFAQIVRWMFLHGRKRKLGKLTFQYDQFVKIEGADRKVPLFVVTFTRAQADALKSWKDGDAIPQIQKSWTVVLDNFSRIQVGR